MVSIKFIQANPSVQLPRQQTKLSSGMDVRSMEDVIIPPGEWRLIPTGLIAEIPEGYEIQVRPRSGLAVKHGITVLNSPGTIDADFRFEIKVILINHGKSDFEIKVGDRIAQFVVCPVVHNVDVEFSIQLSSEQTDRNGGFGSTGVK